MIRVTVWGENLHEQRDELVQKLYPQGMHGAIADGISEYLGEEAKVRTVTLQEPEHGLTERGPGRDRRAHLVGPHRARSRSPTRSSSGCSSACSPGMGLVVLHSGHFSKIFRSLMGTTCALRWRNDRRPRAGLDRQPRRTRSPRACPARSSIEAQEMYGEFFDIPQPDELVFIARFAGGEVFRCGCCFYARRRARLLLQPR